MKTRTTRSAILRQSENVKYASYCSLQQLLKNHEPIAYNSGVYGWNFDVYNVYGVTICTGYRNLPGDHCEGIEEYEKKADAIWSCDDPRGLEEKSAAVEALLKEFCRKNGGDAE